MQRGPGPSPAKVPSMTAKTPGWIFFWPGQYWDPHAVVSSSNNDLSELIGVATKTPYGEITMGHMAIGSIAVIGFMVVCMVGPYLYLKAKKSPTFKRSPKSSTFQRMLSPMRF